MIRLLVCALLLSTFSFAFVQKNSQTWKELDMEALSKTLHRTFSKEGFLQFQNLLQPTSDITVLKKRQAIFQALDDEKLFSSLNDMSLIFGKNIEQPLEQLVNQNIDMSLVSELKGWGHPFNVQLMINGLSVVMFVQNAYFLIGQNSLSLGAKAHQGFWSRLRTNFNVYFMNYVGLCTSAYFTLLSQISIWEKITFADQQVVQAGRLFNLAADVYEQINKSPVLSESDFAKRFRSFWNSLKTKPNLTSVIAAARYRESIDHLSLRYLYLISSVGNYETLRTLNVELEILRQAFGELDAYLSVARLTKEYAASGKPWVLADYIDADKVNFVFTELRNPLLKNSVTNNFQLGKDQVTHWVLTGPHACGKTTTMRSVALAHVLGQSIGYVPAKEARLTPLTSIQTYMNVGDSIVDGKSSFVAEHLGIKRLIEAAKNVKSGDRVLMIVDEPYAKTIQAVGEPLVVDFMRQINQTEGLSVIIATHFEHPSYLEKETNGRVKNYQPLLNDELKPSFKIGPGAAEWWFKDAAKRNDFIRNYIIGASSASSTEDSKSL